ncbi:dihydroorotate dehydrogenase-like protein [Commensalibacter papalotli (ex Servin-Garciduenas et al. 2014)]|uniref:Dihydroorotate dehydrogenase n=1 Tax=Commensalibacter papalotli (ex Servin-Garciduenas et al. 2014) TaxID=1208583 RepID=W7DT13_9PROT|nr:dihydroorotate dehydrogenase-like protein [Commensalibacter papalotli (ex Servin-Garciduenas et al. 2014)]EUK18065.1 Dihydroorotate dehydrogenase [Commensalibacter papalotli (ex Servin-Garciduenas et al. 2014)]
MNQKIDLTSQYLGLTLKTPIIASASPMHTDMEYLKTLEKAGIAAIVLPSLFQEQIDYAFEELDTLHHYHSAEASSYLPIDNIASGPYGVGPEAYLKLVETAKKTVSVPVIASLNGYTNSAWVEYAKLIQEAGADALELNIFSVPTNINISSQQIEDGYISIIANIRKHVDIPLAVKLSPYFTSMGNLAQRMIDAGANGLVLFNRIMSPDIDIQNLDITSRYSLSNMSEGLIALQWIGLLARRVNASLAASTGVDDYQQVVKYLLAGADTVMTTSALLRHGPNYVEALLDGLCMWLKARQQTDLKLMRGQMSWQKLKNNQAYERSHYIKLVGSFHPK